MWTHPESHPGAYLRVRFLEPLGLTAADLARGCRMPRSRVSDILAGKRRISADTALRLAAYFRMEAEDWMALQAAWDLSQAEPDLQVGPLDPVGFLLGPLGATSIASLRPRRPALQVPDRARRDVVADAPSPLPRAVHDEVRYADGTRAMVARIE